MEAEFTVLEHFLNFLIAEFRPKEKMFQWRTFLDAEDVVGNVQGGSHSITSVSCGRMRKNGIKSPGFFQMSNQQGIQVNTAAQTQIALHSLIHVLTSCHRHSFIYSKLYARRQIRTFLIA